MVGVIATVLTLLGRSMTWFACPLLILPLYAVPSVLAIGEVHTQLVKRVRGEGRGGEGEVHTQLVKRVREEGRRGRKGRGRSERRGEGKGCVLVHI